MTNELRSNVRDAELFSDNFASLAGILCVGYCLHASVTSITKNAKNPDKNVRDVAIGYFMSFGCFVVVGVFGYFGFKGIDFDHYYIDNDTTEINQVSSITNFYQNCLNMFDSTNPVAFLVRLIVFLMLFTTYPLINVFLKSNVSSYSYNYRF